MPLISVTDSSVRLENELDASAVFTLDDDGTMVLAKAGPAEYSEISSFKIPGAGERPSWAHPVICDGRLYLRENQAVLCYDIRAAAESAAAGK